jgi:hypothetical protein
MNNFALDKNYNQIKFEEISVAELEVISGGSGGGISQCFMGIATGAAIGAAGGAVGGSVVPAIGTVTGGVAGAIFGAAMGAVGSCG